MKSFITFIFLLMYPPNGTLNLHEFHLSKCTIDYKEEEASLQISLHIFIDDLELALQERGADKLFIGTEKEIEDADLFLSKYLKERLALEINGKLNEEAIYLGKETSEDLLAVWCYLEIKGIKKLKSINVKNQILQELFDDQKNITRIIGPNKDQTYFMSQIGNNQKKVVYK